MTMVKTSTSVTNQQNDWIREQIESAHYGNESEIVRELIRERQMRERETSAQVQAIRAELIEGEQSGFAGQSADEVLTEIKGELRAGGDL